MINRCGITVFNRDVEKIRDGIAEKVSQILFLTMSSVIGIALSFVYGWKLASAMVSYVPIVVLLTMVVGKVSRFSNYIYLHYGIKFILFFYLK